ncbi:MAG: response regulator transcription factor [Halobacteriovoraceae bacterium]|nr:response regulator transcription factor [Halobacteriovoraceae bacterium]
MSNSILIVEDDENIRELINFNLIKEGYRVFTAQDGEEGYRKALNLKPSIILLDIMLPKIDGLKVCQLLRENPQTSTIPIIMITAKGEEEDIVKGLAIGADDYITKPFGPRVFMARIKAMERRTKKEDNQEEVISYHGITIDPSRRKILSQGKNIKMTYSEFQILHLLARNPGKVFSRSKIVTTIHGKNHAITDRAVDVQIVTIRKKLEQQGQFVETVRGVGYRLRES